MLLCRVRVGFGVSEIGDEEWVEPSCDVTHEATSDLLVALAGLGGSYDVRAHALVSAGLMA